MFLSGPLPTFATLALKLAGQAAKGVRDNVNHYNERQRGGALFTVLKNAAKIGTSSERTNGIREWAQRVSQAVTTDVLQRGKYDSITQTTPFLGGYSQRGQSEQATGDVRTCLCRSNQCRERNGSQSIAKQNSRSPNHHGETASL